MYFDEPRREVDILRGAFNCTTFTPKGLGAVGWKKMGKREQAFGFLSGWGLEWFESSRLRGRPLTTFPAGEGNEAYLKEFVAKIHNGTHSCKDLSPCEEIDEEYRTTFLKSPDLGTAPVDACAEWVKEYTTTPVNLYGTFHFSVRDPGMRDWRTAFEMLYDYPPDIEFLPVAFPFISLSATTFSDESEGTYVHLLSASFAWLRDGNALGGHVGPNEADENLRRLADLAASLVNNGNVGVRRATLNVDGALFYAEAIRIRKALSEATNFDIER